MYRFIVVILLGLSLTTAGCGLIEKPSEDVVKASPDDAVIPEDAEERPPPSQIESGVGTVRYVELEGGFYGIVADEGNTRYNPTNLHSDYRQDGLRVRFRGVVREDVVTTQMWGKNLELMDVQEIDGAN